MMKTLKENLLQAQNRMKHFADMHRSERSFNVGDMAYLKIQSIVKMLLDFVAH